MGLVDLPESILVQILETVDPADIPVLHSTSRRLRSVLDARDYLWQETFLQGVHFQDRPASYREAYLEQVSIEAFVTAVVKDLARYRYRDMVDLANRIAELWALGAGPPYNSSSQGLATQKRRISGARRVGSGECV
ncbi:hypothetical protein TRVA0_024S00254 [Trichomonascus vanleenenianus]|uniref:F-box protein n=1 Tax=Trichomonascus vanleenenianus TaxID=2268995 RepID=UPI003ECBA645